MRRLMRDQGLALILVAGLLVVLLGMAGLAVDLGALFSERRQLRNGADAAALAIAEDCGRGTEPCDDLAAQETSQWYADANSGDGASGVTVELTRSGSTGSVKVVTSAFDGKAGLPGVRVPLISLLGFDRVNVRATATAVFGHPASGSGMPLILGTCEFYTATEGGYGPGSITTLWFKDPKDDPEMPCPADPAGKDAPGTFGWLDTPNSDECRSGTLTVGAWASAGPGFSPSNGCKKDIPPLNADYVVPVYSEVTGSGNNTRYLVAGFAAFHLLGYNFPNWGQAGVGCDGSGKGCITGYFTTTVIREGDPGGGDFGVVLVKLVE